MAHANAVFLSLLSGAALVVGLVPGCSNNTNLTAQTLLSWSVDLGTNDAATCPVGGGDSFQIGTFATTSLAPVADGSSSNGVPVTTSCQVSQNGGNYAVVANAKYGTQGSLTISGTITSHSGSPSTWPAQTGISATFGDHMGLIETLSQKDCTITFTDNPNMGIAPTRIWGSISCPKATAPDGKTCEGKAEFLFENCQQ